MYWILCCPHADQILSKLPAPYKRFSWPGVDNALRPSCGPECTLQPSYGNDVVLGTSYDTDICVTICSISVR
jgi:hypothetical protein